MIRVYHRDDEARVPSTRFDPSTHRPVAAFDLGSLALEPALVEALRRTTADDPGDAPSGDDGTERARRSSDVGDVIEVDGRFYGIEAAGFRELREARVVEIPLLAGRPLATETPIYAVDLRDALEQAAGRGLDLSGADLSGADLSGADLRGVRLRGARLEGADLSHADLSRADLTAASLAGAFAPRARLEATCFAGARLDHATLSGARVARARFDGAAAEGLLLDRASGERVSLAEADLTRSSLAGARLTHADLRDARLVEADASGAVLEGADARGARFEGARLDGASLAAAELDGATLSRASLRLADLREASLDGAATEGTELAGADLRGASLVGVELTRERTRAALLPIEYAIPRDLSTRETLAEEIPSRVVAAFPAPGFADERDALDVIESGLRDKTLTFFDEHASSGALALAVIVALETPGMLETIDRLGARQSALDSRRGSEREACRTQSLERGLGL